MFASSARALAACGVATAACALLASCSLLRNVDDLTGGDAAAKDTEIPCTKDCLGGACVNGQCQPVTLVSGRISPWGIAVDPSGVYWSEIGTQDAPGNTFRVLPDGGAGKVIDTTISPMWLFIDSSRLYWASMVNFGAIGRCPLGGVGCVYHPGIAINPPGSIISNGAGGNPFVTNPDRTAADATGVYWTNAGTARDSQDGSVIVCAQAGCGSLGPTVLASGLPRPRGIAIDDAYVYWANEGLSTNPNGGTVMRAPKRGGRAETIASQQGAPVYLATDATTLWWTSRGDGVVMMWSKSGGAPQIFADSQAGAWDIAVDDSGVYWTTWGPSGAVSMCPKSGCDAGVVVLASGLNEPYGIATDDKAVYWTSFDPSNGAVMMIAKP